MESPSIANPKPRRGPGRPFLPGNPGGPGRKPQPPEVRLAITEARESALAAIRSLQGEAINRVYAVLRSSDDNLALTAAKLLLSYSLGTPQQHVQVEHSGSIDGTLILDAQAARRIALKALGSDAQDVDILS